MKLSKTLIKDPMIIKLNIPYKEADEKGMDERCFDEAIHDAFSFFKELIELKFNFLSGNSCRESSLETNEVQGCQTITLTKDSMSLKLNIPDISEDYKEALATYLLDLPKDQRDDFYKYLNLISGYCQNAQISLIMGGPDGVITIEEFLNKSSGFELATLKEFIRFHKEGYSGGDFQHIFLDAFLSIRTEMLMSGVW